ncbi:MAG: serine/threonine-protein kinase [Anaerolineae bacterium]
MLQGRKLGKYEIKDLLGQGGMATVYRGYQEDIDRYVAIKVLPPHPGLDPTFVDRFRQEARTIARLQHPHILPVYDYGTEDNILYLVMAYVEGGSLSDMIKEGPLNLRQVEKFLREISGALDYAHRQGIVHRDLKPANILIDTEGHALLADFGIAKWAEGGASITGTGIVGTPAYMAPEQGKGLPADARSDIYALGVVVYELLTGKQPYAADTAMMLILRHIQDPIPNISESVEGLPPALDEVMKRVLAKEPEDRFQSAADFANAFSSALKEIESPTGFKLRAPASGEGQGTVRFDSTQDEMATSAGQATQVQPPPTPTVIVHPATQPIVLLGGMGIIALVIIVLAGMFLANQNGAPAEPAATPTSSVPTPTPIPTFGRLSFLSTNAAADTVSLVAQGLTPPGAGNIYVAWLRNTETGGTMRLGQLNLDPLGNGSLSLTDIQRRTLPASFNTLIVTIETELGNTPGGEVAYSGQMPNAAALAFNEIFVASENGLSPSAGGGLEGYNPAQVLNAGLLAGAISEGEIAQQHTGLAAEATTAGGLHLHAEHTINTLRGTRDDLDGNGRGENPGRGVGVYHFLDLIAEQLNAAGNAPGVSLRLQSDMELVRVCLDNARAWADDIVNLETELLSAQDVAAVEEQKTASTAAADHMMNGFDQNGNGQVEAFEGECGLRQLNDYGVLISSIDLMAGPLSETP